jgi:hypothetical protein
VTNNDSRPLNVTVSPSSGYQVRGDKAFTLDPREPRTVVLGPDTGLAGAAIGEPGCTVDYDLAAQVKDAKVPRKWIFLAGALALLSFLVGYVGRRRGWAGA